MSALGTMWEVPTLLGLVLKVTAILAGGALAARLLRRRPAATRHLAWLITLASALGLTLLTPIAPRTKISVPAPGGFETARSASVAEAPAPLGGSAAVRARPALSATPTNPPPSPGRGLDVGQGLGLVWLGGFLAVLLWSLLGHMGLARLDRGALPIDPDVGPASTLDPPSRRALERRVRLGLSPSVGTPLTWGWPRSVILLPREAESWPVQRWHAALRHELAHVTRGDYLSQLIGTLACAVYWFHPAVWLAAARLRSEGEQASDDRVLIEGTPAQEYAASLLEVARGARRLRRVGFAGVAMARSSRLEDRLLAVLDGSRPRGAPSRLAAGTGLVLVTLALVPFAGLVPRLVSVATARPTIQPRLVLVAESTPVVAARTGSTSPTERPWNFERTLPIQSGRTLRLDLETGGEVSIRSWDEPAVRVQARLGGKDWRDTRVQAEQENGGVVVRARHEGEYHTYSTSHFFEIRVPRRCNVRLSSAGGALTIRDVEGTFRGDTGGGDIVLENDKGSAHLSTGGGDIRVSDSQLDGSVSTGGGMVRISRVRGGLRGSSGSGPVIQSEGEDGPEEDLGSGDLEGVLVNDDHDRIEVSRESGVGLLRITKAGGDVDLEEAPKGAIISTGGGDVRVGRAAGTVEANTEGGDVEIGPVAGSVKAETGAGNVRVFLRDADSKAQDVDITSGSGRVVVELPNDFDGRFELETAYTKSFRRATRIESAWTLDREATTNWDPTEGTPRRYIRARGEVGKGRGLIRVKTVNGDIEVRRASNRD